MSLSEGFSKSGALIKLRVPVAELIVKNPWSFPPLSDQVTVSSALKVKTFVVFSLIDIESVSSPLLISTRFKISIAIV